MKTLQDHTIIYDNECPMCDLYTRGFTKSGMLSESGRKPFSDAGQELLHKIDQRKACDEIALVNTRTGETTYGLDSLLKIIGNSFPVFTPLFRLESFRWLMKRIYSFVSYNRKVIIPGKKFEAENTCTPTFNIPHRIAYLVFTWLISSFILNTYSANLSGIVPASNFYREFLICGGQILFQAGVLFFLKRNRILHYLGNMMTISFAGSLLLLVGTLFNGLVTSPYFYLAWFMVVVGLMFLEHTRRVKILEIHWSASATWVIYRFIVLWILGLL
jgi:predicted DCC family thiol-disulfide oxidoreductase YuxK